MRYLIFPFLLQSCFIRLSNYHGLNNYIDEKPKEETITPPEYTWEIIEKTAELQRECELLSYQLKKGSMLYSTEGMTARDDLFMDTLITFGIYRNLPESLDRCLSSLDGYFPESHMDYRSVLNSQLSSPSPQ
ncbi:MAG: hypothetical protein Q8Q35_00025 [Nanoarchaeota archaeon]|nr:hypothetical protein [Nanoarchaeota archaeon]